MIGKTWLLVGGQEGTRQNLFVIISNISSIKVNATYSVFFNANKTRPLQNFK